MLNRWDGIGNLGKDPELRFSTGENRTALCRFSIAVDKGWGKNKKTVWVNIVAFGKTAENCDKYLSKGSKVFVSGELDIREYTGQDGIKRTFTEVAADKVEFLNVQDSDRAPQKNTQDQHDGYVTWPQYQRERQQTYDAPAGFDEMARQEEIPF